MALQKEKTLSSGETGNYWVVSHITFKRKGMVVNATLSLYKSAEIAAAGGDPLPLSYPFEFTITQQDIAGGSIVAVAYTKIKAMIDTLVPPIDGIGESASRYPDLVGCTEV